MHGAIPALTGIKGLAAVWVVMFHLGLGSPGFPLVAAFQHETLIANGFRGVDLFFILSGFILMHAHGGDFDSLRWRPILRFAGARCLRVYPTHLAALTLILATVALLPGYVLWSREWNAAVANMSAYNFAGFIQTATLSNRWLMPDFGMWNGVTWSLSVEMVAYGMLPPLAYGLRRCNSNLACAALALGSIAAMLVALYALGNHDGGSPTRLGLLRGIGGFAAGASAYRFVVLTPGRDNAAAIVAVLAIVLTVALILTEYALFVPFAFTLLIPALAYQRGRLNTLLSSGPVMFLGRISYSLYLVHVTPLLILCWYFQTSQRQPGLATWCGYGAVVVGLAVALHVLVERPAQRLRFRMPAAASAGSRALQAGSISLRRAIKAAWSGAQ
jgi:peptidoglycan/LPS O-acetylase OafA/YrhL